MTSHFLLVLTLAATVEASAQGVRPPREKRCGVDTTAQWYRQQRAWLKEAPASWKDDTLRTALLKPAGVDASGALPVQFGWELQDAPVGISTDPDVTRLKTLATTRGAVWPMRSVVGAGGVYAVYVISGRDTALLRASLHRMMEAGPDESPAANVAVLEDRLRLQSGRKQIYGTQFHSVSGKPELLPMEDSAHVDLRREDAQLPPFRISACLVRQAVPAR